VAGRKKNKPEWWHNRHGHFHQQGICNAPLTQTHTTDRLAAKLFSRKEGVTCNIAPPQLLAKNKITSSFGLASMVKAITHHPLPAELGDDRQ